MILVLLRRFIMTENTKRYSEMEKYEIININDGERYGFLSNNDILIDDNGYFKLLILDDTKSKISLFQKNEFIEVPWNCIKKIGSKTIIMDASEEELKRNK
jgi:YlmC/YmxH family sporulation protein